MAGSRETIFEIVRVGAALKVIAVDAETGTEAVLIADPASCEDDLTRLARRKLEYVLAKRRQAP